MLDSPRNYVNCETVFELLRAVEKDYSGNIPRQFVDEWKLLTHYKPFL